MPTVDSLKTKATNLIFGVIPFSKCIDLNNGHVEMTSKNDQIDSFFNVILFQQVSVSTENKN